MKKRKKIILLSSGIIICLAAVLVLLILFFSPLNINKAYVVIRPFEAGELEMRKEFYARHSSGSDDDGNQFIASNPFPSEEESDYCHVYISFLAKNRGPFKMSVHDGYILNTEDAEFVIYKRPIVFHTEIDRFGHSVTEDGYELFCYRQGMSDDELLSKVRDLTLLLYYETDFQNSLTYKLDLSKLQQVDFNELTVIREQYA